MSETHKLSSAEWQVAWQLLEEMNQLEKKSLYKVFAAYCRGRKLPIVTETTFFKNLPQHIALIDLRASIAKKDRFTAFKGIRYSEGVSGVSSVSRDFLILSSRRNDFLKEPWKVIDIPDESSYIKIGITLDTLDTVDAKQRQLPIVEVYRTLRSSLKEAFYQQKAYDLIMQERKCSLEEAEKIFQTFVDEGKLFKNSYGLWMWA